MLEILTILAPVFFMLALGYGFGKTSLFPEKSADILIAFVWYIAIPALLFGKLASRPFPFDEMWLIASYYSVMLITYGLAMLVMKYAFKGPLDEQAMFAFTSVFSNGGFIGIPILEGAYGAEGVRLLLIILSFHSLTLMTLTTIFAERARSEATIQRILGHTVMQIKDNPIIIALLLGLTWSVLGIPYPEIFERILTLPAAAAAPVGLFAVGLSLTTVKLSGALNHALAGAFIKMGVYPALMYVVSRYVFDLPDLWVGVSTLVAALSSGMIPYSFALRQNLLPRRVASMILISVIIGPFSLFFVLYMLGVGAA